MRHIPYDVYLNGKEIDTVFYGSKEPAADVRRSLIEHDGYDPGIIVKRRNTRGRHDDIAKGT